MITFLILAAAVVIGIPLLVLCWALLLVIFSEHAIAAVVALSALVACGPVASGWCVALYFACRWLGVGQRRTPP
jgi:hypothetical protein